MCSEDAWVVCLHIFKRMLEPSDYCRGNHVFAPAVGAVNAVKFFVSDLAIGVGVSDATQIGARALSV